MLQGLCNIEGRRGFTEYVTRQVAAGEVRLSAVFNPNQAKKSWMSEAVRDTFFEKVDNDEPGLVEIPVVKAPKFLQGLESGGVLFGKDET